MVSLLRCVGYGNAGVVLVAAAAADSGVLRRCCSRALRAKPASIASAAYAVRSAGMESAGMNYLRTYLRTYVRGFVRSVPHF